MTKKSNQLEKEQREAMKAFHKARAEYTKQMSAATKLVGIGKESTDRQHHQWRSVRNMCDKANLELTRTYERAKSLGCFNA